MQTFFAHKFKGSWCKHWNKGTMGKREGNGQLAAAEPCHPYSVPTYGKLNGLYVQFCSNFLLKSESKKHANEQSPLFLRSGWDFFIGFSNNIRREVDSITPLLRKAAALYISIRGPTLSLSLSHPWTNKLTTPILSQNLDSGIRTEKENLKIFVGILAITLNFTF